MEITDATLFGTMGGEEGVRRLVDRFYDLMDTAPEAATVRRLHARGLERSRERLTLFLVGWAGGPPTYAERHGHPRLRMRHRPFSIGARERDEWTWCMDRALDEADVPEPARQFLRQRFRAVADHLRNRPEE